MILLLLIMNKLNDGTAKNVKKTYFFALNCNLFCVTIYLEMKNICNDIKKERRTIGKSFIWTIFIEFY